MNRILMITRNGKVFRCNSCNKFHIEFNNLCFHFNDEEHQYFADYIESLDGKSWEESFSDSVFHREIMVSINYKNVSMLLTNEELSELETLLCLMFTKRKVLLVGIINFT